MIIGPPAVIFQGCLLFAKTLATDPKNLPRYSEWLSAEKSEKDVQLEHDQQRDLKHDGAEAPPKDEAKLEAGMVENDEDDWRVKPDFLRKKYGILASWVSIARSEGTIDKDGEISWKRTTAWTWGLLCKIEEFRDGSRRGGILLLGRPMVGTF